MVKEVEFNNIAETLDPSLPYVYDNHRELFEGTLSNDALNLSIRVNAPLRCGFEGARQLYLQFGNIDFDSKLIDYVDIGTSELDAIDSGNADVYRTYDFDLSKVLIIPRKIYNTQGSSEIVVELYTYEANITTDYGTKRLSVPYTITSDTKYEYDKSTDGIYRLVLVDYDYWLASKSYGIGDIVYFGGGLIMSIIQDNQEPPQNTEAWIAPTYEDIINFAYGTTENPPVRATITDMLISRYAKYSMIMDVIISKGFKGFDDDYADRLALILNYIREKAKFNLMAGKVVDSAYSLQMLKLMYSNIAEKTAVRNFNIQYTI